VDRDPLAGIVPAPEPVLTAREVDAALVKEGWRHVTANSRQGYWFKVNNKKHTWAHVFEEDARMKKRCKEPTQEEEEG